ncbi:MAG: diguanylate cyclase [Patescibacteria group bacterium]|nr:diguanylate cyclase [Patescibacteria group bacterium]
MPTRETAEKLRITETESMRIAARTFDERLKAVEAELEQARASGAAAEQLELLELEASNIRLEKDLYLWQHDTTGAWKGDRLGLDLKEIFESQKRENPKTKALEFGPEFQRTHILMVNMGELDRLNESGEHELGDRALEIAVARINETCQRIIKESHPELSAQGDDAIISKFNVYRIGSNDFSVIVKDIDAETAKRIQLAIGEKPLSVDEIRPGEDPAPMTVDMLSFSDAAETYKRMAEFKQPKMPESTYFISILKEKAQTINDFNKIRSRFFRLAEKIRQPGGSIDARTLYDKYLQRSIGASFGQAGEAGMDFDDFVKELTNAGALDSDPVSWQRIAFSKAAELAIKQYLSRNLGNRENAQHLLDSVLEDLAQAGREIGLSTINIEKTADFAGFTEIGEEQEKEIESFERRRAFLGETEGEQRLKALTLSLVERDFGTDEKGQAEKRKAELELAIEKAKRDNLTGLSLRGVFYQTLESRLEKNEAVSIVSIDMAFLKYFDKEGGTAVGNEAIRTASRVLDHVRRQLKELGVGAEACRLGGDEFALAIGSADKEIINKAVSLIRRAQAEVGVLPTQEGALTTYAPEALQFNIGISVAPSREEFIDDLKKRGVALPANATERQLRRKLADHLAQIADMQIESVKNVERFVFLLNRSLSALNSPEDQKAARQMNLKTLMAYSEKAIFGASGKEKISAWLKMLQEGTISVKDLVGVEIIPFVKEELHKKGKDEFQAGEALERAMEYELRLALNQIYIDELENSLQARLDELGDEHEHVQSLKKQLETVKHEMGELRDLRQRINTLG